MPGKRRILSIAVSAPLLTPAAEAAPTWDCRASASGGWDCYKDGVLVAPEPTVAVQPPPQPAPDAEKLAPKPEVATQPASEVAAQPEPKPKVAAQPVPVPLAAPEQQPEPKQQPTPRTPHQPEVATLQDPAPTSEQPTPGAEFAAIDSGLNWAQCSPGEGFDTLPITTLEGDQTQISADGAEFIRDQDLAIFSGAVEARQGDQILHAQRVEYNNVDDTLHAEQEVLFAQPGLRVGGASADLHLATNSGTLQGVEYRLIDRAARGGADSAEIIDRDRSRYTNISYTTCRPGNSDWLIEAAELELDRASGVGTARNAKVSFKGVPFAYAPYLTFPIDDRRKSGLLTPSIGYSDSNGADISLPYYFNLAPNYDLTLTPRIISERGLMLGGEFRYLLEQHSGELRAELLPSDSASSAHDERGSLSLRANGDPATRWHYDVNLNHVSDDDYFDDLGGSLAVSSTTTLERRADLAYHGNGWHALGRVQNFQTLGTTAESYDRLPQLLFDMNRPDQTLGLTYHLRGEYVSFGKSSGVTGERLDLYPALSLPLRRSWGFLTPKLGVRYTSYDLEDQAPGLEDDPTRTTATLSVDSGLYFERETNWFGDAITQTLEPRLYYLYTPHEDQSALPDFDTAEHGFSFASLFRENRFSGADKVGDANQLTLALTSRNLDRRTGEEFLRASLGQIYYFSDREVQLQSSSGSVDTDDSSAFVAEVAARISRNWRTGAGLQWNPHLDDETEKAAFAVNYNNGEGRLFNFAYRFDDGDYEKTDISASLPLNHQWNLVGRWDYSLMHSATMEAFAGVEYDSCCWSSRLVLRQHRIDANAEPDIGIFLQLELTGLTSLGDRIDQFLEDGILGYTSDPDK
ncbi:MAG: LPS-assembly protein LptD [Candidatus Sedimenticola endophacoides]|uniref:LPS-assembly protein LptD n=1 Tax=Candidatus Sedimenticola endophacoides TaxID=2548426 RepID=A0A6N4DL14_9GAMM|nr:MAG: LPS-assembly protein LptD [Candidatus Sedimenticola endophacoides]PUD99120.1 MAG: LPS-assembly protein LptD [Candidatus Sedimenticola endophacoides]PUE02105.1 MAG: LPS-assembly protein LptD [Candidatus Sedimenticola endophacoides]